MEKSFSNLIASDDKEIVTETIMIKDNILKFNDITLHLSNIAVVYAGKKKLRIPYLAIVIFLISCFFMFQIPSVGFIGGIGSGLYIWSVYKSYLSNNLYLNFQMNSGQYYRIYFSDKSFLEKAKSIVENSFNNKNMEYIVKIEEQKIVYGNDYKVNGDNNVIDTTIQEGANVNSHNKDSFNKRNEDNSVKIRDIKDSSINGANFGNNNNLKTNKVDNYDWKELGSELEKVIEAIKIDSDVKEASIEALHASKAEDRDLFESTIKKRCKEFSTELFRNTADKVLQQIVNKILEL
ncbi:MULTISPECIES: hypothetical protein [Bacillus]|uniref:hypothetical protein n=1 Tax=Bacillus TaxID=1386 RepID=UPI0011EF736F|nr:MULTISPECIES: hypothetical protein [Bacillus]KAA0782717.1 hypothetical protein DN393_25465 [Bacillus sp. BPN334]MBY7114441.1 hypothetical protein [Bacillus sp. 17RED48]MCR6845398.1 hypothetical protein [Bacillus sp. IBL03825]MCU5598456.1 hypothetical protein [Bacillus wiedmannii]